MSPLCISDSSRRLKLRGSKLLQSFCDHLIFVLLNEESANRQWCYGAVLSKTKVQKLPCGRYAPMGAWRSDKERRGQKFTYCLKCLNSQIRRSL